MIIVKHIKINKFIISSHKDEFMSSWRGTQGQRQEAQTPDGTHWRTSRPKRPHPKGEGVSEGMIRINNLLCL